MTSLFTARRRAEDFADAVASDARGTNTHHGEFAELVGVVSALRTHQLAAPEAEFAADLRARLMVEAATALTPAEVNLLLPVRTRGARERRLVAVASAAVLIGGTATMAAAAQNALPGEALYPIKRGIESVEAKLSISSAGEGRDLLNQASDRLAEVEGLLASDSAQSAAQIPRTLDEFSTQATEGSGLLLESFRETRDPSSVVQVRTFAADGIVVLEQIAGSVPADAQDELAAAAITLGGIDAEAAALCRSCAPELPELQVPDMFLARAEVDRVMSLVAFNELDNSHPVVVRRDPVPSSGTTPDEGDAATPGATVPTPDPDDPAPVPSPDGWTPPPLPTTGLPDENGKTVKDGLNGVVETLLPDAEVTELLP